jgi:hypothetical protein
MALIRTIDMHEFLPAETLRWCDEQMSLRGIDLSQLGGGDLFADGSRVHLSAYLHLRDTVRVHILSGAQPLLSESPKPTGGYSEIEQSGGYFASICHGNAVIIDSYDRVALQELDLAEDFQDNEEDVHWVAADGIIVEQEDI